MIDGDKMTLEEHRKWREMERKAEAWDDMVEAFGVARSYMRITDTKVGEVKHMRIFMNYLTTEIERMEGEQ